MTRPPSEQPSSGQTTLLVLGLLAVCLAITGVAIDGTRAFLLRRTLQNAADTAALAAADRIDLDRYYSSGGRKVLIEPTSARSTLRSTLVRAGVRVRAEARISQGEVRVVLRATSSTTFLALLGLPGIPVAAEARARPVRPPP